MDSRMITEEFKVTGMTCRGCEARIERILSGIDGICSIRPDSASNTLMVCYDSNIVSIADMNRALEKSGYAIKESDSVPVRGAGPAKLTFCQFAAVIVILAALYLIVRNTIGFTFIPAVRPEMGYALLFVVGLLTSLHCVAMCGGISISQCVSSGSHSDPGIAAMRTSLMYNSGRIISYTIIGGIAGAVGSAVSFSGGARGIVAMIAGLFMIIMGINLLGVFPPISRITPRLPRFLRQAAASAGKGRGPLAVGLLNGLMPCGPLQTMQLYALGTGNFAAGAASMFFFSLGTTPLMFGLGAASTLLGGRFTGTMMKISAVLVLALGFVMMDRGLVLSGIGIFR